jgi:hypothetical protein
VAFVHLGTRSSVNAQSSHTNILQTLCYLINIYRIVVPTQTRFTVTVKWVPAITAFVNRIIKSTSFKTPAPAPLQTTFFDRASKIDINNIWIYGRNNFRDKAIASSSPPKSGFQQVVRNRKYLIHSAFDCVTN